MKTKRLEIPKMPEPPEYPGTVSESGELRELENGSNLKVSLAVLWILLAAGIVLGVILWGMFFDHRFALAVFTVIGIIVVAGITVWALQVLGENPTPLPSLACPRCFTMHQKNRATCLRCGAQLRRT